MKHILIFILLCFASELWAQYPAGANKLVLGRQTTGDGLIFRGNGSPAFTPANNTNAWFFLDTAAQVLYTHIGGNWVALADTITSGGSVTLSGEVVGPSTATKLDTVDRVIFDPTNGGADSTYKLTYNANDFTLHFGMGIGDAIYQMGQELYYPPCINKTAATIYRGQPVMIDTAGIVQGDRLAVMKAFANGLPANYIVGVAAHDIAPNNEGLITWFGYVREVKESEVAASGVTLDVGDILYLSATPGKYQDTEPTPPALNSTIALVVRKPNANNMTLLVRPWLNEKLGDLTDVDLAGLTNGQVIVWDSANSKWVVASKQDPLTGTGLVKSTSGTITYVADSSANWNAAYNDRITGAAFTGTDTKTLTLTQQDAGTITANFTDLQGVTSVATGVGLSGGTITTSGTISADTTVLASKTWVGTRGYLTSEVDGSITNEGSLTVSAGTGTTSVISSNTSGSTDVTIAVSTGLSIAEAGNTITLTNSAPDQTVVLTAGTGISTSGTYPNFTIASTAIDSTTARNIGDTGEGIFRAEVGNELQFKKLISGVNISLTTADSTITIAGNAGTVTSITAGAGLTGGTITTSGTIATDTAIIATISAVRDTASNLRTVINAKPSGSGAANKIAYWSASDTLTSDSDLHWNALSNKLGIGNSAPFHDITFKSSSSSIGIDFASNISGGKLSILSGGTSGENLDGGDIELFTGNSTGTGKANIIFNTSQPGASGSSPNFATETMRLTGYGQLGIGTTDPQRLLHVAGEVRITDLTTDTPTRIVGADADGDLGEITTGTGISLSGGTLTNSLPEATTARNINDTGEGIFRAEVGNELQFKKLVQGSGVTLTAADSTITIAATGSSGTVTSITAGAGLTGGTITTSGTIAADTSGVLVSKSFLTNQGYTTNAGTVTSIATGTGLTGGTITGSGTVSADTTVLSTKSFAQNQSPFIGLDFPYPASGYGRPQAKDTIRFRNSPDIEWDDAGDFFSTDNKISFQAFVNETKFSTVARLADTASTLRGLIPTTLYSGDGTLAGTRKISTGGNTLEIEGNNSTHLLELDNLSTDNASVALLARGAGSAARFTRNGSTVGSSLQVLEINRETTGTAANGLGGFILMNLEADNGTVYEASRFGTRWTTAANASRASEAFISTVKNASESVEGLTLLSTGQLWLKEYGDTTFTGTAVKYLGVADDGKVIEVDAGRNFGTVAANKVAFGAASGDTLTSNTNLHWDNTNGRLGINNTSPSERLQVGGNVRAERFVVNTFGSQTLNINNFAPTGAVGNNLFIGNGGGSLTYSSGSQGSNNIGIGTNSLLSATTANLNIGIGVSTLQNITTGFANVAIGGTALQNLTSGEFNVAIGAGTLLNVISGFSNLAIGTSALAANTGDANVAIGTNALVSNTSGGNNTAISSNALQSNTTGLENVAIGANSFGLLSSGNLNVGIGNYSGRLTNSGANNTTTNNGVYIGSDARPSASGNTNETVIGFEGRGNGSNTTTLGNTSTTGTFLAAGNLNLTGQAATLLQTARHTTSNTAGNNLTLKVGGATSGATDKNGGDLVLESGVATGTGSSSIKFSTPAAGTTGTTDRSPTQRMEIGAGGVTIGADFVPFDFTITMDGENNQSIGMSRSFVTNGGKNLTVQAGGNRSGANAAGGNLILSGGLARGINGSEIILNTALKGSSLGVDNTPSEVMRLTETHRVGIKTSTPSATLHVNGSLSRNAPITVTANYTVVDAVSWLICNGSGTITLELPTAADWTGRELMIKTIAAQTVVSDDSNVVPLAGGSAGTAILAATAGKWATLVSDGTNWIIMQAN